MTSATFYDSPCLSFLGTYNLRLTKSRQGLIQYLSGPLNAQMLWAGASKTCMGGTWASRLPLLTTTNSDQQYALGESGLNWDHVLGCPGSNMETKTPPDKAVTIAVLPSGGSWSLIKEPGAFSDHCFFFFINFVSPGLLSLPYCGIKEQQERNQVHQIGKGSAITHIQNIIWKQSIGNKVTTPAMAAWWEATIPQVSN